MLSWCEVEVGGADLSTTSVLRCAGSGSAVGAAGQDQLP